MRVRPITAAALILCLLGALATGLSGYDGQSNHPTYLPPALHYLDPEFLANDWWLTSAVHYHVAFFALAVVLAKIGPLEWGLALINIGIVAAALFACFRILERFQLRLLLPAFATLVALFLATRTFYSAGDSYLFSATLQPSAIAAAATIWALVALLAGRFGACGVLLAAGGLFHANFLMVNLPFFCLAYLFAKIDLARPRTLLQRSSLVELGRIAGPSLLLLACFVPLILALTQESLTATQAAESDWIFFHFAVPFHYLPSANIGSYLTLAAWQGLGAIWTGIALCDPRRRRLLWAVQGSLALILWGATALTTIVFIPQVSRLFLWRLAPFAVLISATILVAGIFRVLGSAHLSHSKLRRGLVLLASAFLTLVLTVPVGGLKGQILPVQPVAPVFYAVALLLLLVALRWFASDARPVRKWEAASLAGALLVFGFLAHPGEDQRSRYSLVLSTPNEQAETELFDFVRRSVPADAQFVIPPELAQFRLRTGRAIIADFKALPLNRLGLLEWYRRLEDISGVEHPAGVMAVRIAYGSMDAQRLALLQAKYGIDYAVFRSEMTNSPPGWKEVFRNESYRVLAARQR